MVPAVSVRSRKTRGSSSGWSWRSSQITNATRSTTASVSPMTVRAASHPLVGAGGRAGGAASGGDR